MSRRMAAVITLYTESLNSPEIKENRNRGLVRKHQSRNHFSLLQWRRLLATTIHVFNDIYLKSIHIINISFESCTVFIYCWKL